MSDPEQVVRAAREMRETPFRWQGREPGTGLDCSGLVVSAFKECGITLPDRADYAPFSDYSGELIGRVGEAFTEAEKPSGGALVGFWLQRPGRVRHLGIITEQVGGTWLFIHTHEVADRVIEEPLEHGWLQRVESFWRLKEWQP
jgi:cell wall-associated NlpC family hydrolase